MLILFRCCACGMNFSAMEWNNATRKYIPDDRDFIPIQNIYDSKDKNLENLRWFCPNCSIDKPDVIVKISKVD